MKVCHFTSAHPQEDVRIFQKECVSLAANGFEVYQVSCGNSYNNNGVHLFGVGKAPSNRLVRMLFTSYKVYRVAKSIDADLYHFHDPELLPYGLILKKQGKKVIFDSHEDIPGQILDKQWIPRSLRQTISYIYKALETFVTTRIDAVVTATNHIENKFLDRAAVTCTINNYPKLDDIVFHDNSFDERDAVVCYAGGISYNRGELIMKEAMKGIDGTLLIAGDHEVIEENNVKYLGKLNRIGINDLYSKSIVGLCILQPIENYYYSQPIKLYEYMASGIPFVCSNFPQWQRMVLDSNAGICVDPNDIHGIREAINDLFTNRAKASLMGTNGFKYVSKNCNWNNEEIKLLNLYNYILH